MSTISLSNLSVQQLKRAVVIRENIEKLEKELSSILGETAPAKPARGRGKKRVMSPEARARIAAAQRARWAKRKRLAASPPKQAVHRRKMSNAAKARIAAGARARWARIRAAKGNT
jgi:hypothetical protein